MNSLELKGSQLWKTTDHSYKIVTHLHNTPTYKIITHLHNTPTYTIITHLHNFKHQSAPPYIPDFEVKVGYHFYSLFDKFIPKFHERPDGSGCGVELGHFVLVYDGPEPTCIWVEGCALKLQENR